MKEFIAATFHKFSAPFSMGVVTDTKYTRCFWPRLDKPTALFADGSSGIVVEGPPTPRNVIFPDDTVFAPNTRSDCHFLREKEYVSTLPIQQAKDIATGKIDPEIVKAGAAFVHIEQSLDAPDIKVFKLIQGVMTDVTDTLVVP